MHEIKAALLYYKDIDNKKRGVFLLGLILLIVYFVSASIKGGDFVTFLEASEKMLHGKNIYDPPYINLRYSYSPFWAMVLIPFALLPIGVGPFIWLLISFALLCRSIYLLRTDFQVSLTDKRKDALLWFLIILYMSRYIELNFHHVQMTIFLLWAILESIILAQKDKEVKAGVLIGLGAIIKIMPIVFIPYLIYRRRFITAFSSLLTLTMLFFSPAVFLGINRFQELNRSWLSIVRPDSPEFLIDATWHFPQNLSTLMYRLLVDTGAPYTKNIASMDYSHANVWIWGAIGILIVLTLYFLNTLPFKRIESKLHVLYETSYIALLIPLIFPHQMKYAFYFVLPAICCLGLVIVNGFERRNLVYYITLALVILSFLLSTATTDLIIGMHYSTITQHLKTITIGTLLLIPALVINKKAFTA